jgi:hypothetical protein
VKSKFYLICVKEMFYMSSGLVQHELIHKVASHALKSFPTIKKIFLIFFLLTLISD